jgi:3-carboxy-cis,cis-muconate cycloisomerase
VAEGRTLFLPLVDVFGDEEILELFSEEALVEAWLQVERALALAQSELGILPADAAAAIAAEAIVDKVDLGRLREETRNVGYPILPLLEQIKAASSPDVARYLHWGATTQDVMDTGLALTLARVLDRVEMLERALGDAIASKAEQHRTTVMAGRTHGQHAVPITFGGKLAVWLAELERHVERLRSARARAAVVQLFGAAGTGAALGPEIHELRRRLAARLSLEVVDVPWHTARDGLAEVGFVLAAVAATCGKIAREVIELSRPEIGELREAEGHHRGASSTMPQKVNPIGSETVVGLSVLAAQQIPALLAAMQAGHERATGEWQIEWDAIPGIAAAAAGALAGAADVVGGLHVFPERMRANLEMDGGLIMAEAVMMAAATIVGRGQAHDLVYQACATARREGIGLAEAIRRELGPELVGALPPLETLLDPTQYLGETDAIVSTALEGWARAITLAPPEAGTAQR